MSDAQTYYDGLISQGYLPEQAVTFTQQYYPDFQGTAPAPAPAPAPAMEAPQMTAPMIPQPMATEPSGEGGIDIMAIAAVVCIVLALILSAVGQFNGSWLSSDADETGMSTSSGLSALTIDCSEIENQTIQQMCIQQAVVLLSEGMTNASIAETTEKHDGKSSITGATADFCQNRYDLTMAAIVAGEQMAALGGLNLTLTDERANATSDKADCEGGDSAGSTGGLVLWIGTIVALTALVFTILGMVGVNLPGGIEAHGKWVSLASGVLMMLAILVWYLMLPSSEGSTMGASTGVFITVFAAVLAMVSGVLGIVGGMSKSN